MTSKSKPSIKLNFVKAVRRGLIKGPQQRGFTVKNWTDGYRKYESNESDKVLFISGVWFHTHFKQTRNSTDAIVETAALTSPLSISAITAVVNREWVVTNNKMSGMFTERDYFMPEELDQTPLESESGNPIYFSNAIETIIDGARFPLAVAANAPPSGRTTMTDEQWIAHVNMFGFGGYYNTLEHYWMHCVWNGYGVDILEREIRIRPYDVDFHQKLTVSLYRRNARDNERALQGATIYNRLIDSGAMNEQFAKKLVLSAFKKGGIFRVKVDVAARFQSSRLAAPSLRLFVYEEHLKELTKKRFPCLAGLSIDIISDAFELLGGLPEQIRKFTSRETTPSSWKQAESLVPKFRRTELAIALRTALKISSAQSDFILSYATWKPNTRNELWFAPLIQIDDDYVSLICLAVQGVNTIRLCDQIISNFQALKPEADRAFEQFLRTELMDIFTKSKLSKITQIFPNAFTPKDSAVGDIDLLFRIGGTIWVGEAKSVANIFSPNDDHNFYHTLHTIAVPQAQRKCAYVADHLEDIAPLLGADPQIVHRVCPVIVTSNPAFAGFPIKGVPVVDWNIIELFFSDGAMRQLCYTTDDGRTAYVERELFYNSLADAEQCFPNYLNNPPQIAIPRKHVYEEVLA